MTTRCRAAQRRSLGRAALLMGFVGLLARSSAALAQGTSPPTPDVGPAALDGAWRVNSIEPAPAEEEDASAEKKPPPKIEEVYDAFRNFKNRLPFQLGAGIYLLYYQSINPASTLSGGTYQGVFQISSFYLKLDKEWKGIGAHIELRFRDSGHSPGGVNPELRSYFNSNIWPQEIYVFYAPRPYFRAKAGKFYRRIGVFWDESFFGNLQYYDGIKLNPDYGVGVEGDYTHPSRAFGLSYYAQFFLASDGINGGYSTGRTVGDPSTAPAADQIRVLRTYDPNPEGERDMAGKATTNIRYLLNGRLVLKFRPTDLFIGEIGATGATGVVDRTRDGVSDPETPRYSQLEIDATLHIGPVIGYFEFLRQYGPAVRDASYLLAGARYTWRQKLSVRFNTSYVKYNLSPDVEEYILQPGVTWTVGGGLALLVEFDEWRRKDPRLAAGYTSYDRSLNFVVSYTY